MEDKIKGYLLERYGYLSKKDVAKNLAEVAAHDIVEIVEKGTPNIMIYQRQLEKQNADLKDEIKHWQDSWDILTKENAELRNQVFNIDRNNMILPIHQWHNMNNDLTKLQVENNKLKKQIDKIKGN